VLSLLTILCISYSTDDEHLEGGVDKCFRLKMWRTVPLVGDSNLTEGAVALGMSSPAKEVSVLNTVISPEQL
jgi:hypothetical protein